MAVIIEVAERFSEEERNRLELVGAEEFGGGQISLPIGFTAFQLHVNASLVDMMTPPLCFNCTGKMERTLTDDERWLVVHLCPSCGAREEARRYYPGEGQDVTD